MKQKRNIHPAYHKGRKANWNGQILRRNCLLNRSLKESRGKDIISCWMKLKKGENIVNLNKKH
jgi:hypothetical protein